jgi:hypothetical protein
MSLKTIAGKLLRSAAGKLAIACQCCVRYCCVEIGEPDDCGNREQACQQCDNGTYANPTCNDECPERPPCPPPPPPPPLFGACCLPGRCVVSFEATLESSTCPPVVSVPGYSATAGECSTTSPGVVSRTITYTKICADWSYWECSFSGEQYTQAFSDWEAAVTAAATAAGAAVSSVSQGYPSFEDAACNSTLTQAQCAERCGRWFPGVTCTPNPCCTGSCVSEWDCLAYGCFCCDGECKPEPCGACCEQNAETEAWSCSIKTQAQCSGTWQGAGTTCDMGDCEDYCCQPGRCDGAGTVCKQGVFESLCQFACAAEGLEPAPTGTAVCVNGPTTMTVTGQGHVTANAEADAAMNDSYAIQLPCNSTGTIAVFLVGTLRVQINASWGNGVTADMDVRDAATFQRFCATSLHLPNQHVGNTRCGWPVYECLNGIGPAVVGPTTVCDASNATISITFA